MSLTFIKGDDPTLVAQSLAAVVKELVGAGDLARPRRSEERRVGKECRSRWSPDH